MRAYSTSAAAKMLGVHRVTLQRAIARGKLKAPRTSRVGGVTVRLWTPQDIERARKAMQKT